MAAATATALSAAPARPITVRRAWPRSLAADGNRLDRTWGDFDILEKAVYAVLEAKPDSPVAVLADGTTPLTAFVPTDRTFRRLVLSLTGERKAGEWGVLRAVTEFADADTLESVLLYHVVPEATITYRQAKKSDGARLTMALGSKIRVKVRQEVRLRDRDFDARNARVLESKVNLNKGNEQIAHGIDRVLRPLDL